MTRGRPYRAPLTSETALAEVEPQRRHAPAAGRRDAPAARARLVPRAALTQSAPVRAPQRPDRELEPETTELAGTRSSDARIVDALLHQADLSAARLPHLELRNCSLRACNLANLHARGARDDRERAAEPGCVPVEARLTDVVISGCRVDLASFGGTRMERVTLEKEGAAARWRRPTSSRRRLDNVRFHGCDLRAVDLRGARLRNTEHRRSELIELQGIESLRGASLEWETIVGMAAVWATALGIKVLDD